MKNDQHRRRCHPAQSLIEFAFTLPILLILILGAMDFGRMFYTKIVLTNAAREGANYLSFFHLEEVNNGYAQTYEAIFNEAGSSNVEIDESNVAIYGCCTPASPVEVRITKTVDLIFDNILQSLGLLGGPVQITSSIKMVVH